jgi:pSer/pThr/pTyr-binding forkhead associated (FHA) protein
MPEPLLRVLTILLMVLLYLFFLRVLRAVWTEVNPPKVVPATKPAKSSRRANRPRGRHAAPQLRVIEPADQRGRSYALGDEITVGRAAGCQVTLDDTYVSQLHARVFSHDGQVLVEDLGSTNGTYLNRRKVTGPMVMKRGDQLQIGSTVMELA